MNARFTSLSLLPILVATLGCEAPPSASQSSSPKPGASAPPWGEKAEAVRPPPGMVYVTPGALVAGTPPDRLPRIADQEMSGEQVILKGFFIDTFPYPNEPGAIPRTNVSHQEALGLCEQRGKRLCSELEWERACKGPNNTTYEYGDRYQLEVCRTGDGQQHVPSAYLIGCQSGFGVHDLHGGSSEWTDSPWNRGGASHNTRKLLTVRGGDGKPGDVAGRCAHAQARAPAAKSDDIGFRCCAGERNGLEVSLEIVDGPALVDRGVDRALAKVLEQRLPDAVAERMRQRGVFRILQFWDWRPIGNERLLVSGGCAGAERRRRCGVMIARESIGKVEALAWVDSGFYVPTVRLHGPRSELWIYGGDNKSHFRRRIAYAFGSLQIGEIDRNTEL